MNQQRYWFKVKKHGWGWTPASWQGWAVLILYILAITNIFFLVDKNSLDFLPLFFFATFVFILICYFTGKK